MPYFALHAMTSEAKAALAEAAMIAAATAVATTAVTAKAIDTVIVNATKKVMVAAMVTATAMAKVENVSHKATEAAE